MKIKERIDVKRLDITVYSAQERHHIRESIAVERPLEIRLSQAGSPTVQLAITMRTPGDDEDLILGFLFSEGIIRGIEDVIHLSIKEDDIIEITLSSSIDFSISDVKRRLYVSSSCGSCGQQSLSDLRYDSQRLPWSSRHSISPQMILRLPHLMRTEQQNFNKTGGLHAAALFDDAGQLISLREDVGRHNALDKLIGANLDRLTDQAVILVSGRLSFELVQKTAMFGVAILLSIGPPSSLAIDTAEKEGITLIGFLKNESFNIYTHPQRVETLKQ